MSIDIGVPRGNGQQAGFSVQRGSHGIAIGAGPLRLTPGMFGIGASLAALQINAYPVPPLHGGMWSNGAWVETKPAASSGISPSFIAVSGTGNRVFVDDGAGRLWLSTDHGVTWHETRPAGDQFGYWADGSMSRDGSTLFVRCEYLEEDDAEHQQSRFYISRDAGSSWTLSLGGLDELVLTTYYTCCRVAAAVGFVTVLDYAADHGSWQRTFRSDDRGTSWSEVASYVRWPGSWTDGTPPDDYGVIFTPNWPYAGDVLAADGLTVIHNDPNNAERLISRDSGSSWSPLVTPTWSDGYTTYWFAVLAADADGSMMLAAGQPEQTYVTSDGGATWHAAAYDSSADWHAAALSSTGQVAMIGGQHLYVSSNYGVGWTENYPNLVDDHFSGVCGVSGDGWTMFATAPKSGQAHLFRWVPGV